MMTAAEKIEHLEQLREARHLARAFAAKYDTPAVRAGIAHAEAGRIQWVDLAALFARSYAEARTEVAQ